MTKKDSPAEKAIQIAWSELEKEDPVGLRMRLRETFFFAISKANAEGALCVLRECPELATERSRGVGALHWTCVEPRLASLIPVLLALGANPLERAEKNKNRDDSSGMTSVETCTPLDWAAEAGNVPGIKRLLLDARVSSSSEPMNQALKIAARVGFGDVCLFLMEQGADPLLSGRVGGTSASSQPTVSLSSPDSSLPQARGATLTGLKLALPLSDPSEEKGASSSLRSAAKDPLAPSSNPLAPMLLDSGDGSSATRASNTKGVPEPSAVGSSNQALPLKNPDPTAESSALEWLTWRLKQFPQGPTQRDGQQALAVMEAKSLAEEMARSKRDGMKNGEGSLGGRGANGKGAEMDDGRGKDSGEGEDTKTRRL